MEGSGKNLEDVRVRMSVEVLKVKILRVKALRLTVLEIKILMVRVKATNGMSEVLGRREREMV